MSVYPRWTGPDSWGHPGVYPRWVGWDWVQYIVGVAVSVMGAATSALMSAIVEAYELHAVAKGLMFAESEFAGRAETRRNALLSSTDSELSGHASGAANAETAAQASAEDAVSLEASTEEVEP